MGKKTKCTICQICGRPVDPEVEKTIAPHMVGDAWFINASIVGSVVELRGHVTCLENVNNLVVVPARLELHYRYMKAKDKAKAE